MFAGSLARLALWSRALTATEVTARSHSAPIPSGLVAEFLFSEGSGTTLTDHVGGAVWTLTGSPAWSSAHP